MSLISALERNIREEETHNFILRFPKAVSPFRSEVEVRDSDWLFYFSDLQVEPQFLSLGFY